MNSAPELVRGLVDSGKVSAATALVGTAREVEQVVSAGRRSGRNRRPPTASSLFDLASLAKPFSATLALRLEAAGVVPMRLQLAEIWQSVSPGMAATTLEALLRHRSGLLPWTPLWMRCATPAQVPQLLLSGELLGASRGSYSDLGYILWAKSVERVAGRPLHRLLRDYVLRPLGLSRSITPSPGDARRLVECTLSSHREETLAAEQGVTYSERPKGWGDAQDGNARWLGGYCGHAGLFGSARALWTLAAEWLDPKLLERDLVSQALAGTGRLRLGWWSGRAGGAAGRSLAGHSFGHDGFTGGSLWVDRSRGRIFVLLAHRTDHSIDMDEWRGRFHAVARR